MSQSEFMEMLDWDEKVDNFFIDFLCNQATIGFFVPGQSNVTSVLLALGAMRKDLGLEFSYKFCMEKLAMLDKRYNVFTWMLTLDDVVHDPRTNKVHAPDCVWDYILKNHSIAHTYRMDGEPKFAALTTIFGRANSTEDNEVLVVSPGASEGHDEHNRNNGKQIIIIDDDSTSVEIVNSPPGKCNGKSKAKRINFRQTSLWDYVEYDSDHSLSTQFSTANTTLKSNSVTLEQARRKSSIPSGAKVKGKMVTSSCASNNP